MRRAYPLEVVKPKRDAHLARFLFELGWICDDMGDAKKTVSLYEEALTIVRRLYGEEHPHVATRLSNPGLAWRALGDAKKAANYGQKAYQIFRKVLGDKHRMTVSAKKWLENLEKEGA